VAAAMEGADEELAVASYFAQDWVSADRFTEGASNVVAHSELAEEVDNGVDERKAVLVSIESKGTSELSVRWGTECTLLRSGPYRPASGRSCGCT
jgi:hypothetical protein